MCDGVCTHTPCRTHISFALFPCVKYRHEHAWLKVFAVRMSYLSISPSFFSCFIRRPCCSRTVTSTPRSRLHLPCRTSPESAGQANFRTSGEKFGYLADPTHSTGYEPKEFDQITSADGDTTPVNDPNYDNVSGFSKITRENTGLFGVPAMLEAARFRTFLMVNFLFREKAKAASTGKPLLDRDRGGKRRFCDQCCRVDVKEKSTEQY